MDEEALVDVAFLTSSVNRVRALAALTDGSRDRYEVTAELGVSRVTAKRVLDGLEERGWVERQEQVYRTTPLGRVVATEFDDLLDAIGTMRRLSTVREWLPVEEFDFDLRRFATARIIYTSQSDSIAPIRRVAERIGAADELAVLSTSVEPQGVAAHRDAVVENGQSAEVVLSVGTLDVAASDPTMATYIREVIETGGRYYRHPGFDHILFECDGSALIGLIDETGAPRGLIESEDEAVCEWVRSTFEAHRAEAEPVAAEELIRAPEE